MINILEVTAICVAGLIVLGAGIVAVWMISLGKKGYNRINGRD